MGTKERLAELANELQDIAATYEELTAPEESQSPTLSKKALDDFMLWLHKEGYTYTRGVPFYKIKDVVQNSMANMSQMIADLQKANSMLLAGASLDNPPEALAQPVDDGQMIDFLLGDEEEEEDQ